MDNKKIFISATDAETLENMISYYNRFTVEAIAEKHAGFVIDDLEKVLKILEKVLEV